MTPNNGYFGIFNEPALMISFSPYVGALMNFILAGDKYKEN
jgi:hypothetical protein